MKDESNGNTPNVRSKQGFAVLPKDKHLALSSKGGKKKGLKGLAWIKKFQPERFLEITSKGAEASKQARITSKQAQQVKDSLPREEPQT